jgi:hypothetical protein
MTPISFEDIQTIFNGSVVSSCYIEKNDSIELIHPFKTKSRVTTLLLILGHIINERKPAHTDNLFCALYDEFTAKYEDLVTKKPKTKVAEIAGVLKAVREIIKYYNQEFEYAKSTYYCVCCGVDLGPQNPRQYCCKTYCPEESFNN